ncbi:hypothetical protein ACT4S2_12200 [Kocuria turfanensis]|uniref:hypothetical protein n=1 Tax=Kocuria turfanensis TaxID=388357 RepID=UPI0040361A61
MGTRLDRKGIREALGWGEELGLVLATDAPPEQVLSLLTEAMARADDAVGLPSADRDEVLNGPVVPTPAGLRFLVDPFDETAWAWLDQLAQQLTRARIAGTITAEISTPSPAWTHHSSARRYDDPAPLLALAYPKTALDADPAATEALQARIVDHLLDWLPEGSFTRVDADGAGFVLPGRAPRPALHRVRGADRMWLGSTVRDPWQRREASWSQHIGDRTVFVRLHDPSLTRVRQLEQLTGLFTTWDPEAAMYGFLAIARNAPVYGMKELVEIARPPARAKPKQYYLCADNYDAIVADAHGIQLLTDRHLARAHDVSQWEVTEIAPNRYLVRARDLEPWYAGDTPEAVAQARADFGSMILTPETVPLYKSATGELLRELTIDPTRDYPPRA